MDTDARRLLRAERRVEILEAMIEDKTRELYTMNQELLRANSELLTTQDVMPGALIVIDAHAKIIRLNRSAHELLGYDTAIVGRDVAVLWPELARLDRDLPSRDVTWRHADGTLIPILLSSTWQAFGGERRLVCVGIDLRERHRDEIARRHAQKLESLGQLAAGVAHEINTPMQFISDNLHVIKRDSPPTTPRLERAFTRALEGVARVTSIVGALKLFSHPANELRDIDLNHALTTTLAVARPELRHVAEVDLQLGEVPAIRGHAGDLNMVFLNLLVNAAHAIGDARRGERGRVTVRTEHVDDRVRVSIADTGTGIPEAIQQRIFDPFFTTKEPGRGTGQGLAIAHAVVVERHGGTIRFETSSAGTTFHVELLIQGPP